LSWQKYFDKLKPEPGPTYNFDLSGNSFGTKQTIAKLSLTETRGMNIRKVRTRAASTFRNPRGPTAIFKI